MCPAFNDVSSDFLDHLADLYAVVVQIEKLEKARNRDLVADNEYNEELRRLFDRYREVCSQLTNANTSLFSSAEIFLQENCNHCIAALSRIRVGHPEDVARTAQIQDNNRKTEKMRMVEVFDATGHLITLMDSTLLRRTAVDDLLPLIEELVTILHKAFSDFDELPRLKQWKKKLSEMSASEEVEGADLRQLRHDLELSYASLRRFLAEYHST